MFGRAHVYTGLDLTSPSRSVRLLMGVIRWTLFCGVVWALLRPALITTLAADDFVNPFGQLYRSGASLPNVIRESARPVTANGHFNYLGQAIGSVAMFVWLYLIGKVGIHYGTVYALTKFGVYLLLLIASAAVLRHILHLRGIDLSTWRSRIFALIGIVGLIQIHIPWSNDPVASYPLAGFMTVFVGLIFLLSALHTISQWTWASSVFTGFLGVAAIQYYEFNLFAVAAIGPLLLSELWVTRQERRRLVLTSLKSLAMVAPAAIVTVALYFRNKKFSPNYEGTAISVDSSFFRATRNGMISSLPASSWDRAAGWLTDPVGVRFFSAFLVILAGGIMVLLWRLDPQETPDKLSTTAKHLRRFRFAVVALVVYWIGATVTQTSTAKIQREAGGIGQVYNYYAVGATVVGLLGVLLFVSVGSSTVRRRAFRGAIATMVVITAVLQHQLNSAVTDQFNRVLAPNANLLNVFHEVRDDTQRCQALEWWKSLGWPEYYVTDMENGLDLTYLMYRGYEFCKN